MAYRWWYLSSKIRCVNRRICCRRLISLTPIKMRLLSCLFYNQALIISDGIVARLGSLSADFQRFTPWKVVDEKIKARGYILTMSCKACLMACCSPKDLLDYIRYFVLFERDSVGKTIKKSQRTINITA